MDHPTFRTSARCSAAVALVAIFLLRATAALAVPAFPGAEGYGANASGGRGGAGQGTPTVYVVRNRCDYVPVPIVVGQISERDAWLQTGVPPSHCTEPGAQIQQTFRWATEQSGPRTIVFNVSGEISIRWYFPIRNPYLTIAGQTAPSPGITLHNIQSPPNPASYAGSNTLSIETHDVIVRHIRVRPGGGIGKYQYGAVFIWRNNNPAAEQPYNIILDHVSTSWGTDDNVEIQDAKDVTVQWSIIGESLALSESTLASINTQLTQIGQCCTQIDPRGGKAMLIDSNDAAEYTGRISIHHNLFGHHPQRTPAANAGGLLGSPDLPHPVEIVNNVVHDYMRFGVMALDGDCGCDPSQPGCPYQVLQCGAGLQCNCNNANLTTNRRKMRTNIIGNTFSLSRATLVSFPPEAGYSRWLPTPLWPPNTPWIPRELMFEFMRANTTTKVPADSAGIEAFLSDNRSWRRNANNDEISPAATDSDLPLCTHFGAQVGQVSSCLPASYVVASAHPYATVVPPVTIQPSTAAEVEVLANAGALYRSADPVDQRIVSQAMRNTTAGSPYETGTLQDQLNPPLSITPGTPRAANYDTDLDGMPDSFETQHGLNPNSSVDFSLDADSDGYTNLEEFLNGTHPIPVSFLTQSDNDGWVIESGENTNVGGNKDGSKLRVGDVANDRQYMTILSFNTGVLLPDTSPVTFARLTLTLDSAGGAGAPVPSLGGLVADIKTGNFGSGASLHQHDFESPATANGVVTLSPSGNIWTGTLNAAGLAAVNRTGLTQIRVRFTIGDNDNSMDDYLRFSTTTPAKLEVSRN